MSFLAWVQRLQDRFAAPRRAARWSLPTDGLPLSIIRLEDRRVLNVAPVIAGTVGNQAVNDTALINPFSGVTISDADPPPQLLTVSFQLSSTANGTVGNLGGFTADGVVAGKYNFIGNEAAATAAIRGIQFNPTDNQVNPGSTVTTTFSITVSDGIDTASNNATSVVATSINDAPTISGVDPTNPINDNQTNTPFDTVTIGDADSAQTLSVTVSLDVAAKGVFTNLGGFVNAGGGVYTFSGTAAQATTAIRGLTYDPTNNRVAVGSVETTTLTISVDDGVAAPVTNNATTVASTSVNDLPTITGVAVGPQVINDTATVAPFSAVTIGDVDNPAQTLSVTVSLDVAAKGTFTTLNGFTNAGGGNYTFSGTAAQATTAIRGLVFDPTNNRVAPGSSESTTFTITVDDGPGAPVTNNQTVVQSTSVNDAPTITGVNAAAQNINDNQTVSPFSTVTIGDVDSPAQSLQISVQLDTAAKGSFTTLSGFTNAGGGLYTFTGTAAQATTAIRGLVFTPTANRVAVGLSETTTFAISVNDGIAAPATNNSTNVSSTSVNNAPTITGVDPTNPVNDNQTVAPFDTVTIGDVDNPAQTLSVSVTLDNAAKGVFSTLNGFTNAGGGVYTFSGTAAQATTAIRGLVYNPTDNRVAVGNVETTTFTISVNDGFAAPVTNNATTVASTSVNDLPTITGVITVPQAVNDTDTIAPFSTVTIGDVDNPAQTLSVSVTLDTAAKGTFTTLNGFTNAGGGVYTFSGTAAQATTAIRGLVFNPTNNRVAPGSTESTTFTITVDDGPGAPVTNNQTVVQSLSGNDAPTITGVTVATQNINDNQTVNPFSTVTIGDVDTPAQTLQVSVQLDDAAKGSFTTLAGFTNAGGGLYTFTGTAAQATTAIRGLVFTPTANRLAVGLSETTTFAISVSDGIAAPATNNATNVRSTSVNDAPTITGGVTTNTDDRTAVTPLAGITITDNDVGQSITVTVVLDNPAKGAFTAASLIGFTPGGGGVQITGTVAVVTAALRGLVFVPTENRVNPGTSETTTITLTASDGTANDTDNNTRVVSLSLNDDPTITGTLANQAVNDDATLQPFTGVTIADVDNPAQTQTVIVQIVDPAQGTFTNLGSSFVNLGGGQYRFVGTAANATTAIRALRFDPAPNRIAPGASEVVPITISVDDGPAAPVIDNVTTIIVSSINDAPTIVGLPVTQAVDDDGLLSPFTATVAGDVDLPPQLLQMLLQIDDPAKGFLTAPGGVLTDLGGGLYFLSGLPVALTTALQSVQFVPFANRILPGTTEVVNIFAQSHDGFLPSTVVSTAITITSINDAPVLTFPGGGPLIVNITDEDTPTVFSLADFINLAGGVSIAEVDVGQPPGGVAISAVTGNGVWEYSLGGGVFQAIGAVTGTAARLLPASALLRYTPDARNGETATITFRAWDTFTGAPGGLGDASVLGRGSAFSNGIQQGDLIVISLNDAPVLMPDARRLPSLPTTNSVDGVADVADLLRSGAGTALLSDVDTVSQEGIAIVSAGQQFGRWQFSLDGGASWLDMGPVDPLNALLLRPQDKVRFIPDGVNSELASLSFRGWDQSAGGAGGRLNTSVVGGTTAVSDTVNGLALGVWTLRVVAPQINGIGQTTLEVRIEHPFQDNFRFDVDWGDSPSPENLGSAFLPGPAQFQHTFFGNPNRNNPSAPIPISVTATSVADGRSMTIDVLAIVPGEGLSTPQLEQQNGFVNFRPPETRQTDVPTVLTSNQVAVTQPQQATAPVTEDSSEEEERSVYLTIVDPATGEGDRIVLPMGVLEDLTGFIKNLPDGRYRIYLQEGVAARLVIDTAVRQGKPTDPSAGGESTQDRPPTGDETRPTKSTTNKANDDDRIDRSTKAFPDVESSGPELRFPGNEHDPRAAVDADNQYGPQAAIALAGLGLAAVAMQEPIERRLSKARRLLRRMRKT